MSEQGLALKDEEGTEEHVLKLLALYEQRRVRDEMVAARLEEVTGSMPAIEDGLPPILYVAATPLEAVDRLFSPNRQTFERIQPLKPNSGPFASGRPTYRNFRTRFKAIIMADSLEDAQPDEYREFHDDGTFLGVTTGVPAREQADRSVPAQLHDESITNTVVSDVLMLGALCEEFAIPGDIDVLAGIATNGQPVSLISRGQHRFETAGVLSDRVRTIDTADAADLATTAGALKVAGRLLSDLLSGFGQGNNVYLNQDGAIHLDGWPPERRPAIAKWAETNEVPTAAVPAS